MSLANAPPNPYPSIVCFGDSQTQYAYSKQGFVGQLANAYQRRADVVNRGFSGYTTRDAVHLLKYVFSPTAGVGQPILAATVWLGCNDSINPGEKQYVSEKDYSLNLIQIIKTIQASSPYQPPFIIVLGPTPVIELPGAAHKNDRKLLYTDLAQQVVEQANEHTDASPAEGGKAVPRVDFLDTYALFHSAAKQHQGGMEALLDEDGLHIKPDGYEVLFQAIIERFKNQPGLKPEEMPMVFKDWKELSADENKVGEELKPRGPGVRQ
ncbi:SGNH hydrolase [Jaminaea rosea]|uniref:SGNH hydrolase n=1 Tax=Jaminaea rosea TaxID=1569628 RepID=A0A316V1V9_9BASI|nr:SGNH hydrolase [Jaminaea rosea]PWN30541.1 SGNH hydrolase [Jaminaea rosea]